MDRLFLDANLLFSAAYRPGAGLLTLWKLKGVVLCSSRYALEEARINLAELGQRQRLDELAKSLHFFDGSSRELPRGVMLVEKDVPILLAAIEAQADYLLTGDIRHFGSYLGKKIEGVTVIAAGEYINSRKAKANRLYGSPGSCPSG